MFRKSKRERRERSMKQEGKFVLFTRPEFEAWLNKTKFSRIIKLVQDHHTYVPGYAQFKGDNHFVMLNGMEESHIQRGFDQIAQNLTTFPDGTIAICRNFDIAPAGIKGANMYGLCIENVGNFDKGGDVISEEQKKTIIFLNAVLCKRFNLKPSINTVVYHHWYDLNTGARTNGTGTTKSCPGTNFFGGNTVETAQKYFIPLISEVLKLDNELTLEQAIKILQGKGIIKSPAYWLQNAVEGKACKGDYVQKLIIKFAEAMSK
jgi:hypothetical protein